MPDKRDDSDDREEPRRRRRDDDEDLDERDAQPRRRRRDDDEDDRDEPRRHKRYRDEEDEFEKPEFPKQLKIAGYIWVVLGALILISGLIAMSVGMNGINGNGNAGAAVAGGSCVVLLLALFGGAFIHVGLQSINGTARDTLGNGVGSLVFSLIQFGSGAISISVGQTASGVASVGFGVGLMVAGVIALLGREDYVEWRKFNKKGRSSKRYFKRRDDEE